jgi:hypothetical protein
MFSARSSLIYASIYSLSDLFLHFKLLLEGFKSITLDESQKMHRSIPTVNHPHVKHPPKIHTIPQRQQTMETKETSISPSFN